MKKWLNLTRLEKRHKVIRKKVAGTAARPRLSVKRSLKNLYVQLINDEAGTTVLSLFTGSPSVKDKIGKDGGNVKGASLLGTALAESCKEKGLTKVVFDRSGYLYHGRVKALADAARKGGLEF